MTSVTVERPRLRGTIHRYAAGVSAVAFVTMVAVAPDGAARGWLAVYGVGVTTMLAVSAVYHSGRLSPGGTRVLKRVDHSTILLAIAGSYTGLAGLALEGGARVLLVSLVWGFALVGVAIRMLWLDAPYPVSAAVYVAVGWAALVDIDGLAAALTGVELALVIAGGALYSVGAVVYALHRPNPWPATFGYHEVFHALIVVAAAMHVVAVAALIARR